MMIPVPAVRYVDTTDILSGLLQKLTGWTFQYDAHWPREDLTGWGFDVEKQHPGHLQVWLFGKSVEFFKD